MGGLYRLWNLPVSLFMHYERELFYYNIIILVCLFLTLLLLQQLLDVLFENYIYVSNFIDNHGRQISKHLVKKTEIGSCPQLFSIHTDIQSRMQNREYDSK